MNTDVIQNKENIVRSHEGSLDESFGGSGYLSLYDSQICGTLLEEAIEKVLRKSSVLSSTTVTHQKTTVSSPFKYQEKIKISFPVCVSTPVEERKIIALTSTPFEQSSHPSLLILKFEKAVCEELEKCYKKNKRYDWSIVSKVAEDHLLDRVIGRQMGLEYIDMFASLLSRNMKTLLTKIFCLLGDVDLISCKKVSKTWMKIIFEDTATLSRCRQAEEALRDSSSSLRTRASGLTRDVGASRVVFSCLQTVASSRCSSSAQNCCLSRRKTSNQKYRTSKAPCGRFDEFVHAARNLKQHQSLRSCKRCGSPAIHLTKLRRATCIRTSCRFDFCTRCQEAFHGPTPCRIVLPRSNFSSFKTTTIPGSTRSKRNIRRLCQK